MGIGVIVAWVCLMVYMMIIFKAKIVDKKERKWMYLLIIIAVSSSILVIRNISLHYIITFLDDTFGNLSRMVVNI